MSIHLDQVVIRRAKFRCGPLNHQFQQTGRVWIKGANGAGKSSLFMALSGRLPLAGGVIRQLPRRLTSVGVEPLCFEHWTVAENFKFITTLGGHPQNIPAEIAHFSELRFGGLSLGQRRQVELSTMLSIPSEMLLLDEAFSCLDQRASDFYLAKIEQLSKSCLVLMTSHTPLTCEETFSL